MKDNCILTAESVTEGHPDKLCDTIADAVVDACLTQDAAARVACEVMATAGKIIAAGEITAAKIPDIPAIICRTVREAGYGGSDYEVEVITHEQSPDIAEAVCGGTETGAGDQGILYGFACDETKELLPLPVVLAHRLTRLLTDTRRQDIIPGLRPDGKAQVSVEYRSGVPYRVAAVVVSCQHEDELPLPELRRDILRHVIRPAMQELPLDEHTEVLVNPSGRFVQGGFEADTGLTGRKLMVDTYGGLAPHGGGALSGKDGTKVDRSGAYMARYIARNIVAAGLAKRCTISLAYAIGKAQPVAVTVDTEHTGIYSDDVLEQAVRTVFNLTPDGMIGTLGLDQPMFQKFCNYGHFTHADAPWEHGYDRGAGMCLSCQGHGRIAPITEKARERSSLAGVLSLHGILECLAGLESRRFGSGDFNGGSGGGILAGAGDALLHLEGAKAQQLYLVTGLQRSLQRVDKRIQSGVTVLLGQAAGFRHGGDQFCFIHRVSSPSYLK